MIKKVVSLLLVCGFVLVFFGCSGILPDSTTETVDDMLFIMQAAYATAYAQQDTDTQAKWDANISPLFIQASDLWYAYQNATNETDAEAKALAYRNIRRQLEQALIQYGIMLAFAKNKTLAPETGFVLVPMTQSYIDGMKNIRTRVK